MSKIAFYEGCYVELSNGDHVGPVRMVPREIGDDTPSAYYDDRVCEWNAQGQWTDGDKTNPKNIKRVLTLHEGIAIDFAKIEAKHAPAISQAVVDKGMEAGLKAKPAYEEFVRAILTAALAEHDRRPLTVMPFQITRDAWREAMWRGRYKFDHAADRGQKTIDSYLVDEIQVMLETAGYAAKNESVPEKAASEKTEVQSRLPFSIAPDLIAIALDEAERKSKDPRELKHSMRSLQIREIHNLITTEVAKNESVPEKAAPDKTEVQSGLKLYRHKKTGGLYELLGIGNMQSSDWYIREDEVGAYTNCDEQEVAIYRAVTDGRLWVRPRAEFEDGRFEHEGEMERESLDGRDFGEVQNDVQILLEEFIRPAPNFERDEVRADKCKAWMTSRFGHFKMMHIKTIEGLLELELWLMSQADGPQTAKQAEEIAEHKADRLPDNRSVDRLHPALRAFLVLLYPHAPLRAAGLETDTVDPSPIRFIEANYGQRGHDHAVIRIQISGPAEIKFWKDQ